jgi:site-specific recombinase XerD
VETSFGLLFYLKKPKHYKEGNVPIYFRITVDGVEREISTKLDADPSKWSTQANRLVGKSEAVKSINDYLDVLQTRAINARTRLTAMDKPVTADSIKALVQNKPMEAVRTIMNVFKDHNDKMRELIGREYSEGIMERYDISYRHTISFMQQTYGISDMPIDKLDYGFLTDYEHWLKSVRNCQHNTAMKYLSYFKKIVRICIKKKWLNGDPFVDFKMTRRRKRRIVLSQIDLSNMAAKQFSSERLVVVRDIFLFSCFTGLAYADVAKLKKTDMFTGIDGYKWISCKRKKTERNDSASNIPLLPAAEAIVNKYSNDPMCVEKGLVLPVRSNQKMNEYLKEIADLCEIKIPLTFHIARHTFATTVTLSNKVPIETVSKLLAHQKIATTQEYAQILDHKISDDMSILREKFAG